MATPENKSVPVEVTVKKSPAAESAGDRIAEALKDTVVPAAPAVESVPEAKKPDENLAEANRKLDSLLGNLDGNQEK